MKQKDIAVLALVWAALYIPYIVQGGWVRDDLALLTAPRLARSYFHWQWFISGNQDLTARPVSAILHGLCYWFLGNDAWRFHLVNLVLFGAAVIFFYLACSRLISRDVAFLSSLLALVYPCASTIVFSSIMMNSNLAALCWSAGLFVAAGNSRWKLLLTTALFALSALSYEVFIPLFGFIILVDIFILKLHRSDRQRLLLDAIPALVAVGIYGVYRGVLEKMIFHTTFSRIVITGLPALLAKLLSSLLSVLKIAAFDSVTLSIRSFGNLRLLPAAYLGLLFLGLSLLAVYVYRARLSAEADVSSTLLPANRSTYAALVGLACCLFGCAVLIYALSYYTPSSLAWLNRTLEGVQYAASFSIALLVVPLYRGMAGRRASRTAAIFLIVIFALFAVGTVGQGQAWVLAGQRNEQMAIDISSAIRSQSIDRTKPLALVAVLPTTFPGAIDAEPTLGVDWDITPLLLLHNPDLNIRADVYNPTVVAAPEALTITNYNLTWTTRYPLWLYSSADHKMYWVESQAAWNTYLPLATAADQ